MRTRLSGTVNLWAAGNIPVVTRNVNNSDGPGFIPNLEVFTVADDVHDIADMLTSMTGKEKRYDLYGRQIPADTAKNGVYIVKRGQKATKILK